MCKQLDLKVWSQKVEKVSFQKRICFLFEVDDNAALGDWGDRKNVNSFKKRSHLK